MEWTVRLDPDVEEIVRAAARERNVDFDRVLNDAVRVGVNRRRVTWPTYHMGSNPAYDLTRASAIADGLEDEERIRKMREYEGR